MILLPPTFLAPLFLFISVISAQNIEIVYKLAAQLPPVAYVNKTWSFTLLPGTFTAPVGSIISLSSRQLPAWANFDASTFTFSGVPSQVNKGLQTVEVQANSSTSAIGVLDSFNLLVVDTDGAFVRLPIATQLPNASSLGGGAALTADGALIVPPSNSFSIGFQQYTFQGYEFQKIYYAAYQTGSVQLPSWLQFDPSTVTFNGYAPMKIGEYSITIFGSEYSGYGDLQQTFKLQIGLHSFGIIGNLPALNATPSNYINYIIPLSNLHLDNALVTSPNLSSTSVNLVSFPYLTYDKATRAIAGLLPSTLTVPSTLLIPVTFVDTFNDSISTNLTLNILPSLFTISNLPNVTARAGVLFEDDLSAYATSHQALYQAVIPPEAISWLGFNATTLTLFGTPPPNTAQQVTVSLLATNAIIGLSSSASIIITVLLPDAPSPTSSPTPTNSSAPSTGGLSHQAILAIVLVFGIIGVLILLGLLAFCCRRYLSDGEQRIRREGSTLIFDEETIAAMERIKKPNSKLATFAARFDKAEKDKAKASQGWGRPEEEIRRTIADDADAEAIAAATAAAYASGTTSSKPNRFNLMSMFGSSTAPKKDIGISLPISQNSLFGLGIGDAPVRPAVIVMSDLSLNRERERDGVPPDEMIVRHDTSGLERSSSWESQGSSSLFYSEGSESEGRPARRRLPNSAPRQRRDFVPAAIRIPSPSPERSQSDADGIRLVEREGSSRQFDNVIDSDSSLYPMPSPPAAAYVASSRSPVPLSSPRLIPFTSKGVVDGEQRVARRYSSQIALRNHKDPAMEDADEEAANRKSALYEPTEGSLTPSAVYFTTPTPTGGAASNWESPSLPHSEYDERTRLVPGSTDSSPYTFESSGPRTPRSYKPQNLAYGDPVTIQIPINQPLRFTPRLGPPPSAIINNSPAVRNLRSTYHAYVDGPDSNMALPNWIRFDERTLQLFGAPQQRDTGSLSIVIVERKSDGKPSPPTRRGSVSSRPSIASVHEEVVVSRMILEVGTDQIKKSESGVAGEEGEELQFIVY